jgi:hypothetical protein
VQHLLLYISRMYSSCTHQHTIGGRRSPAVGTRAAAMGAKPVDRRELMGSSGPLGGAGVPSPLVVA